MSYQKETIAKYAGGLGFLCTLLFIHFQNASAQNVGIGTTNPVARLHVADSNVLFSGPVFTSLSGLPPISGPGIRLMWYPNRAAFRAGYVTGSNWNKDSTGFYSFATGYDSKAKGDYSTAIGFGTTASGRTSTALGYGTVARGWHSTVIGFNTMAKALGSTTVGRLNDTSDNPLDFVLGPDDRIFQVGNGNGSVGRSNAMTILGNGNTGIGTVNPIVKLHISTGNSGNFTPFSPVVVEGDGNTYMNLLTPNGNESGILFGKEEDAASGGIIYNSSANANGIQFRVNGNDTKMILSANGNLGINQSNPQFPLHFASSIGDKIAFYGQGSPHYGIGIQGYLLQIHTDGSSSDIAFGYGSSGSFTEKFRMKGNGAFVVNGNAGQPGQVLQSNGSGAPAIWSDIGQPFYQFNSTDYQTDLIGTTNFVNLAGINGQTIVVSKTSKIIIIGRIAAYNFNNTFGGVAGAYLSFNLVNSSNTVLGSSLTLEQIGNGEVRNLYGQVFIDNVPQGTYTINARLEKNSTLDDFGTGSYYTVSNGNFIVQIFPK